ncbi:hypothetical protein Tco_0101615, partial [Tanacetum coccineum]
MEILSVSSSSNTT